MKQTAVECLKQDIDRELKHGTKMIVNWDMYLQMEKEQQDKFATEFGKWLENLTEDFYSKNDECSYSELLEIFKNK